jgi:hypothetical protein
MATFFIDTDTGQVATQRQLMETGIAPRSGEDPGRPWFRIKGTGDATTLWYAVMRKQTKGVYIGALCLRHSDHHTLLLQRGWQEVDVEEIKESGPHRADLADAEVGR